MTSLEAVKVATRASGAGLERVADWYAAYADGLRRLGYLLTGDWATAEDLVQETFVRLHRARHRVHDEGVGAFARRTLVNLSRSRFKRRVLELRAFAASFQRDAEDKTRSVGERDAIWRSLNVLSPQQRACIVLRYYEDLPESEIAEFLGVSPGAVKKHTSRATEKLRKTLEETSHAAS